MIITGMSFHQFKTRVIDTLNATKYADNNIRIENFTVHTVNRFSVKLGTTDSFKAGSRTAASGRHGKWLSWHGSYDVINGAFDHGATRVQTGAPNPDDPKKPTVYRSRQDFFDQTAYGPTNNVGNMTQHITLDELAVDIDFDSNIFDWKLYAQTGKW